MEGSTELNCHSCEISFDSHSDLKEHKTISEHFYHEKQFRRHKVLRHTQKQPYKCNRCDKIFVKRLMAMRHLRFHSRMKPWHCSTCNYISESRQNVRLHVKKVHKKECTKADVVADRDVLAAQSKLINDDMNIIEKSRDKDQSEPERPPGRQGSFAGIL